MARMSLSFLFLFFSLVARFPSSYCIVHKEQLVPALFVFGDSVVDNGNNAVLDPGATTGSMPYGIDFPSGPTGRFTNGLNPADVLANFLNFTRYPPALMDPKATGEMIIAGVNYASGGSGILDYSNSLISLRDQIKFFENKTLPDLKKQLNETETELSLYLAKSIFAFNTGGNDIHELCEKPTTQAECDERLNPLMANFTLRLEKLYSLGARKYALFGVQPLGCNPGFLLQNNNTCDEYINYGAEKFSSILRSSLESLKHKMPSAEFVYINAYKITEDAFTKASSLGFEVVDKACCITSNDFPPGLKCEPESIPCKNRDAYIFFDGAHCSTAMYRILVEKGFKSEDQEEVYPFNISHLAHL